MQKLALFVITLTAFIFNPLLFSKYEYVKLKMNPNITAKQKIVDINGYNISLFESIELKSGDTAMVVGTPVGRNYDCDIFFYDGYDLIEYDEIGGDLIVGPGLLYVGYQTRWLDTISKKFVTLRIERASETGSTTLAWSGTEWTNPNSSTQIANNSSSGSVQYDTLLGWCYFTDTPWLYSYTNGSWYYMQSINNEVYVWNANLPDGGWTKLRG